ncbi:hypothetical protein SRABI13_00456 [Erwinia aphidicola]|uniref:hypothetical protein n=1 Tax=Erwinia aphidicola TaxID=68334 RepID=UPI001DCEF13B|nr:hypothetical protein [Erwinia aphidicola]CAH0148140.1 hypothetical protein SRABI13_00456 [Erwinia aphidicola]
MARFFGKIFSSIDFRHAVVAYAGDPLLQDKKVTISGGVPADLVVGSVVALSSAELATSSGVEYAVVIEPAYAGDAAIIVANPIHTILKSAALVFANGVDADAFRAVMASEGYTFADVDQIALPTT